MSAYLVRCRSTKTGRVCNAFVARVPFEYSTRIVKHSGDADPDSHVSPCVKCGTLHEIIPNIDQNGLNDVA